MSYENGLISWLMYDGWQVFAPILDHGHKTDILISDGPNYYRIQVKTIEAQGEDHILENRWEGSNVDYVIYIVRIPDERDRSFRLIVTADSGAT